MKTEGFIKCVFFVPLCVGNDFVCVFFSKTQVFTINYCSKVSPKVLQNDPQITSRWVQNSTKSGIFWKPYHVLDSTNKTFQTTFSQKNRNVFCAKCRGGEQGTSRGENQKNGRNSALFSDMFGYLTTGRVKKSARRLAGGVSARRAYNFERFLVQSAVVVSM